MSGPGGTGGVRGPLAVRAALALYPAAWRARYGDEVLALIEDSCPGGGLGAAASLAWRAIPAWIWPPRHLHDRPARMRASLATVLLAWSMLAGLGLLFAQLTQLQGYRPPGHPLVAACYAIFDAALALSVVAGALGGLPLWLLMLRRARREHRPRETACLLLPVIAPVAYWLILAATVRLIPHAHGVSPWWFLAFTVLGFAAAATAATGPGVALRTLRPRGGAVRIAALAAGLGVAAIDLAAVASVVAVIGLHLWEPGFAGHRDGAPLGVYLGLVTVAAVVATVSAARGARAALAEPLA
jgi:hypothetical protein